MTYDNLSLLPQQQEAMEAMMAFTKSGSGKVFVLLGYAGTGKTTLLRVYAEWPFSPAARSTNGSIRP